MKKFLKFALRAGSISFAKSALQSTPTEKVVHTSYHGGEVFFREGTSDALVIYEILLKGRKSEYWHSLLPKPEKVKVVLDIGANIGASTVFFNAHYPNAQIHSFEPIPDNFTLLQKNVEARGAPNSIHCHMLALSNKNGELQMIHSPDAHNYGGWSFYQRGAAGTEETVSVPMRSSGEYLQSLGLTQIDVIKIDTEGAEKEILQGLAPEQLASVQYIVGELHGERDFELLDWLEQHGFDIECKKTFHKPCFIFKALRTRPQN